MIYQIRQGIDVDKKSNELLRSGFLFVLLASLSFGITVLLVRWCFTTYGVDRMSVLSALLFGGMPGFVVYLCGRVAIDAFRSMGRYEVIERSEIRDMEEALCQLRKEIGHGTPQPPSRETIEAFDAALKKLRESKIFFEFFYDLQIRKYVSPEP